MGTTRAHTLMRQINDNLRERRPDGSSEAIPFFCERACEDCFQPIWLTPAEYDLIVDHGMSVVVAGHEDAVPAEEPAELAGAVG